MKASTTFSYYPLWLGWNPPKGRITLQSEQLGPSRGQKRGVLETKQIKNEDTLIRYEPWLLKKHFHPFSKLCCTCGCCGMGGQGRPFSLLERFWSKSASDPSMVGMWKNSVWFMNKPVSISKHSDSFQASCLGRETKRLLVISQVIYNSVCHKDPTECKLQHKPLGRPGRAFPSKVIPGKSWCFVAALHRGWAIYLKISVDSHSGINKFRSRVIWQILLAFPPTGGKFPELNINKFIQKNVSMTIIKEFSPNCNLLGISENLQL